MATRKYSKKAKARKTRTYRKKARPKKKAPALSNRQRAHFFALMAGNVDDSEE